MTLDLDSSDIIRFSPTPTSGIVVLRPGREISLHMLHRLAKRLAAAVEEYRLEGKLWIVEPSRIRIRDRRTGPES